MQACKPGRRAPATLGLVCAWLCAGCAAQLGTGVGVLTGVGEGEAGFAWGAQLAGGMVPAPEDCGLLVGVELEGMAAEHDGARWMTGVQVGVGQAPAERRLAAGWEAQVDLGTENSGGTLLRDGNFYAGLTGSLLLHLGADQVTESVNDRMRILVPVPMLVLSLRPRLIRPLGDDQSVRFGAMFQVALRVRFVTDYF